MFNDGFNGGGVMEDLVIAISMFGYSGNSLFVDILDDVVKGYGGVE